MASAERFAALVLAALAFACGDSARERELAQLGAEARQSARIASDTVRDLAAAKARVAELEAELATARARPTCPELEQTVAALRVELAQAQEQRLERERAWLRFTETLSALKLPEVPESERFVAEVPEEERAVEREPEPVDQAKLARQAQVLRSLRTLLQIEGVRGLDLLEAGELGEGFTGPVVFRLLDERGRLDGSLCAQRLRLEGSRSARTLTLVLEDGYEMHAGVRTPFAAEARDDAPPIEGGVRRLQIVETDPKAWVAELRELFGDAVLDAPIDDGKWNLLYVTGALNRLLRADASNGYWRLRELGGVRGDVLCGVHLEGLDRDGKLERRLFADRLRIVPQEKGYVLELEDGAQVRGDEKAPFLDGRFRIFLPRAIEADWRAAGLPGLSEPTAPATPGPTSAKGSD